MCKPQASFATALTILAWPMALLHPSAAAMHATERSVNRSRLMIRAMFAMLTFLTFLARNKE